MWSTETIQKTTASKKEIWALWSDTQNWNVWDHGVEYVTLDGPFHAGSRGVLKPVGGPKVAFVIQSATPDAGFTDRSSLPFCNLDFIHSITETPSGLEISHKAVFTGPLSFFFRRVIGNGIAKDMPVAVAKLISIAEERSQK